MAVVLIVDDEGSIADLLAEIVTDAGHIVMVATNGCDALTLAQRHHPALVISDVMMPQMDGYTLARALKEDAQLADILVVLISANFRPEQRAFDTAAAFVPKPLNLRLIESLLVGLST